MGAVYDSITPDELGWMEELADVANKERRRLRSDYLKMHPREERVPTELQDEHFRKAVALGLKDIPEGTNEYIETFRKVAAIISHRKSKKQSKMMSVERKPTTFELAMKAYEVLGKVGNDPHRAVEAAITEGNVLDATEYAAVLKELWEIIDVKKVRKATHIPERKKCRVKSEPTNGSKFLDWPIVHSEYPGRGQLDLL